MSWGLPASGRYVTVLDRQVHYVECGSGERTLVALHGFGVDHRIMTGWLEATFAGRSGWRRIYLDLPGMGGTDGEGIDSTDGVFNVVLAAIEALSPGDYALAGSSYGAYLARGVVAVHRSRVRGLALSVPLVVADHGMRQVPEHAVLRREPGVQEPPGFGEFNAVVTSATIAATQAMIDPGVASADAAAIERIAGSYAGTFALDGDSFEGPALVLLGRQDHVVGYRDQLALLEAYPRATWAVLDTAGHNLPIDQPGLAAALTTEWLDRVEDAN